MKKNFEYNQQSGQSINGFWIVPKWRVLAMSVLFKQMVTINCYSTKPMNNAWWQRHTIKLDIRLFLGLKTQMVEWKNSAKNVSNWLTRVLGVMK